MKQNDDNNIQDYYKSKIQELELKIKEKQLNFLRFQAQRNDLHMYTLKSQVQAQYGS